MIAQAAAIQDRLACAGLPVEAIHGWWSAPRRVLRGLSPAECVELVGARAGAALLDLATSDVADLQRDAAGAGAPAAIHANPIEGRASTWTAPEA